MAINFPDAPVPGQIFQSYVWDGEKWLGAGTAGAASVVGAVRYDAAQALTSAQTSQGRANVNVTKRNYIINGGMQISQENGTTASTLNGYFAADMFSNSYATSGVLTSQQVISPTPGGSSARLRFTATTADAAVAAADLVIFYTRIEGVRFADLKFGSAAAKTITIQFGVKAPAGTYCVSLRNPGSYNRSYVAEYVITAGEANTDVVKTVTIPGETTGTWATDNTTGIEVIWCLMGGTSYQQVAGSWLATSNSCSANQFNFMGTINNVFEIFDVSLTEGSVAPPFQLPDSSELALCQRYYRVMQTTTIGFYAAGVSQTMYLCLPFNEMRSAPSLTVKVAPSNTNCTISTATGPSVRDMRLDITPAANGACFSIGGIYALNARI